MVCGSSCNITINILSKTSLQEFLAMFGNLGKAVRAVDRVQIPKGFKHYEYY